MKNVDMWDEIIKGIEPFMLKSHELLNNLLQLSCEESNINESNADVVRLISEFTSSLNLNTELASLISEKSLYFMIWEKLEEICYNTSCSSNNSRTIILELLEKTMLVSIENKVLNIDEWNKFLNKRKELNKINNIGDYVYKKVHKVLLPERELDVYDYFYNIHSKDKINTYLADAKENLMLACSYREKTKKNGQGLTRAIINYIHSWQKNGILKPMKSIYPFCICLEKHWEGAINLGTRQGLEATYKQRL